MNLIILYRLRGKTLYQSRKGCEKLYDDPKEKEKRQKIMSIIKKIMLKTQKS